MMMHQWRGLRWESVHCDGRTSRRTYPVTSGGVGETEILKGATLVLCIPRLNRGVFGSSISARSPWSPVAGIWSHYSSSS